MLRYTMLQVKKACISSILTDLKIASLMHANIVKPICRQHFIKFSLHPLLRVLVAISSRGGNYVLHQSISQKEQCILCCVKYVDISSFLLYKS